VAASAFGLQEMGYATAKVAIAAPVPEKFERFKSKTHKKHNAILGNGTAAITAHMQHNIDGLRRQRNSCMTKEG